MAIAAHINPAWCSRGRMTTIPRSNQRLPGTVTTFTAGHSPKPTLFPSINKHCSIPTLSPTPNLVSTAIPIASMAHRLSLTDEIYLGDALDAVDQENEQHSFVIHTQPRWAEQPPRSTPVFNKIVTIINLLLSVVLALSLALVAHSTTERCHQSLEHVGEPAAELYCE